MEAAKIIHLEKLSGRMSTSRHRLKRLSSPVMYVIREAALKKKTADLEARVTELDRMMDEARKTVKLEFEPQLWKKFGIADKR